MLTSENANGTSTAHEPGANGHANGTLAHREALPERTENRLDEYATPPGPNEASSLDRRKTLTLFCYDTPESIVGRFVSQLAEALTRQDIDLHLFARHDFQLEAPNVFLHVLGESSGDLLEQVHEFSHRSCNAFLKLFPSSCSHVTLMGFEWATIPGLSILRGIKSIDILLSLHSLERQRSDMSSELSRSIEEIELGGLREARAILVHEPATAEVARFWVPECAERVVAVRQRFPVELFQGQLDAGQIKARYQVGPVDPMLLYVGDLDERYGPDLLLKAMPAILKNNKQVRLVVVGEGQLFWPLRVYARYLLLEHAVRLVGSVEGAAMQELVQAADVVVVPSREATPWWPILAGWAAGKPVVATHEAAPGLLEHGQDSILCYSSINSCVWGVERVLFDPELQKQMPVKGRAKLEDRFGWNAVAAQVAELVGAAKASAK